MTVNISFFHDLDAVATDADGALGRGPFLRLFDRLDWYRLLQRHCPPEGELLVARAETRRGASDENRSWLFLTRKGGRAASYANFYSLRAGVVDVLPTWDLFSECQVPLAAALRKQGLWRVEIGPEPIISLCETSAAFEKAGWKTFIVKDKAIWQVETDGMDFATFWAQRPGKLRNTFKRKVKAAALDIEIHQSFDAKAWEDYEAVYRASWKPEEASFAFWRALAEQEGAAGTLRLGIAFKDGRPVAAQFWTTEYGEAYIHKLVYVEDAKAMSPGTILSEAMFRQALDEDHVRLIDYGLGDEPYKAEWMTGRVDATRLLAFNPGTLRGLAGTARALVGRLRSR